MTTETPANPVTVDSGVRIIDQRVDWFELRFRVVFRDAFVAALRERSKTARRNGGGKGGRAPFRWASGELVAGDVAGVPLPEWRSRVLVDLIASGDLVWSETARKLEPRSDRGQTEIAAWRGFCRGRDERIEHAAVRAMSPHAIVVGQLRVSGKPGHYVVQNADYRLEIDTSAAELGPDGRPRPGWNFKVQWRAKYLAEHGADAQLSRVLAAECGSVVGAELMRLDLALTLAGWAVRDEDRLRVVKRSRSACTRFYEEVAPKLTAYGARDCTGFMVAPGNEIVGRIYDKRAELVHHHDARWRVGKDGVRRLHHASEKGRTELDIWRERGADPDVEPISRVEFQLRGAALEELGLRDPRTFKPRVDAAWAYLVGTESETIDGAKLALKKERARLARARKRGDAPIVEEASNLIEALRARIVEARARGEGHPGWMRMIEPMDGRRRTRARLDPRWRVVRSASFVGDGAKYAARRSRRVRLGASLKQSIGATLSALADASALDRFRDHEIPVVHREFPRGDDRRYEYLSERQHLEGLHESAQKHLVQRALEVAYERAAILAAEQLLAEKGPLGAAEWLVVRINAVVARREEIAWNHEAAALEARTGPDAPHPLWDAATKARFLAEKAERDREADRVAWANAVIEPRAA